ncbi:MAG: hypothetical protein M3R32_04305 [Chloroflexota bacterium]|nr:hypothetical protein [Chloroflexota bacterium]
MMSRALGLALAILVAGCSTATPDATVTPSSVATASVAAPTATPDLEHPVGIIAIGHSGLTGEGTDAAGGANKAESWATGDSPAINSVYLRLVALRPETKGHVANTARGGAGAALLVSQAQSALATVPAPMLAVIQTADNDILCDGSNIPDVGQKLAAALALIHEASPNTKILVAGQLGRPSVAFIKELVAYDPNAKIDLTSNDDCSFFDSKGNLRASGIEKLSAVIDAYEAETARVCATVPNCATDGGVRKAYVDKIENFSRDYAHLNERGQAAEAELIWPVIERILGI